MPDRITPQQRSEVMRRIRQKDTSPEMRVRRAAHALGYRFRLHRRDLPGCPDVVFPGSRRIIFVHGCFWHQHANCKLARTPKSRLDYWLPKLRRNQERDERALASLEALGWKVQVVWECQVPNEQSAREIVKEFLSTTRCSDRNPLARHPISHRSTRI